MGEKGAGQRGREGTKEKEPTDFSPRFKRKQNQKIIIIIINKKKKERKAKETKEKKTEDEKHSNRRCWEPANRTDKSGMQRNWYILPACIRPKLP